MKRISIFFFTGVALLVMAINFSCLKAPSNSPGGNGGATDFVLLNLGYNIILPAYDSLAIASNSLDSAITDFNLSPTGTKLNNVQALFITAYVAWQSASEYEYFGPASTSTPTMATLNIFPTDTAVVDTNINRDLDNINTFANTAAKGFPALDYLLFGRDNATLLAYYTTDAKAANRQRYLATVSADIKSEADRAYNLWSPGGGNYISTFVTGTGNDVSSSLGLLLNSMDKDFETLKNDRLGIPLGKIPVGSSLPISPNEVEAYFSGISKRLAIAQLKTVQAIYLGAAGQDNGLGLNNYLTTVEQEKGLRYNGGLLSDTIKATFTTTLADLQAIPDPLSANLSNSNANAAFQNSQLLVALLKADLPSDLMVSIYYGDTDGD